MTPPDERRSSEGRSDLDQTFERIRRDFAHIRWMLAVVIAMQLLALVLRGRPRAPPRRPNVGERPLPPPSCDRAAMDGLAVAVGHAAARAEAHIPPLPSRRSRLSYGSSDRP